MVNYRHYLVLFLMMSLIVGIAPVATAIPPDPYFPQWHFSMEYHWTTTGPLIGIELDQNISNRGGAGNVYYTTSGDSFPTQHTTSGKYPTLAKVFWMEPGQNITAHAYWGSMKKPPLGTEFYWNVKPAAPGDTDIGYIVIGETSIPKIVTLWDPNAADTWVGGEPRTIVWNQIGLSGTKVKLDLYKHYFYQYTIATNITITQEWGNYMWFIPVDQATGSDYQVEVRSLSMPEVYNRGNEFRIIQGPPKPLYIIAPNGGEYWQANKTHEISFISFNQSLSPFEVDLYKNNVYQYTIANYSNWKIPAGQAEGSDYQIEVRSVNNPTVFDRSDGYFTITQGVEPYILVDSPSHGQSWEAGTPLFVTWYQTGLSGTNVKIDLYDGKVNRSIVSSTPASTGFYIWTIPADIPAGSPYVVLVTSLTYPTVHVYNNGWFTITAPQTTSKATQIGVFRNSTHLFYLDYNGNGTWNGAVIDRQYNFGISGDIPITGDWNLDNRTEIGVFRNSTHLFYLDYNGNGAWNGAATDRQYNYGISGDIPISGDWNLDGRTEIGVFRNSTHMFYLDYNGNGAWNGASVDRSYNFGITGDIPIAGDWNADGRTEIGVFRNSTHLFYLDYNGNGAWNGASVDRSYNFGITGDIPISGDWNANGRTDIGVFRSSTHLFYLDYNGNGVWNGASVDRSYNFGMTGDIPLSMTWG